MQIIPYFVYLAQGFCLNSARNPAVLNKWLVGYNFVIVAAYAAFLVLRASESTYDLVEVNQIVVNLQLVAYVVLFAANMTSNWTKSTTFYQSLLKIDTFDKSTNFGTGKKLETWIWLALVFLCYVMGTDAAVNLFIEESVNFYHWIAIYWPLVVNYVSCVCTMASFQLVYKRFALLETTVDKMLTAKANGGRNVRRFAKLHVDLTEITEAMFGCFSLQIGVTCLTVIVTVTNNIYLCLKVVDYTPLEYLTAVNFTALHVVEFVGVVCACHVTKSKSDKVVGKATELLFTSNGDVYNDQVAAGVAAIKANRIDNSIYGVVTLTPATLLGLATTIATYLIIMLQFTSPDGDVTSFSSSMFHEK